MDHWLVCFSAKLPPADRERILREAGAARPGCETPLGAEIAVEVDADASAVVALRRREEVLGVFPNSEMGAY